MPCHVPISRRALVAGLFAAPAAFSIDSVSRAEALPTMSVMKDPSCGCCSAWVDHIRAAGFPVEVIEEPQVSRLKARLGVPPSLASCHTAQVGGYVIEGHVPADAVKRLLAERPRAKGLAVPGMPVGSPGMEVDGLAEETFEVVLFGPTGATSFARYRGARQV